MLYKTLLILFFSFCAVEREGVDRGEQGEGGNKVKRR